MNRVRDTIKAGAASATYGAATGSPLTILIAWVLNTYVLPEPMPVDVAAALGAVLGGIVLPLVQRMRQRRRERGERKQ